MHIPDLRDKHPDTFKPGEIIIPAAVIDERIKILAEEVTKDYRHKKLLVIGLLTGAAWLTTDLFKRLHALGLIDAELSFMKVASYFSETTSQKEPRIDYDLPVNPEGKHILIVDDIADTGKTLSVVEKLLVSKDAKSVKSLVLIDKPSRRTTDYQPSYVGFIIPDIWIQGRGMDTDGYGRGDPNIIKGPFKYPEK